MIFNDRSSDRPCPPRHRIGGEELPRRRRLERERERNENVRKNANANYVRGGNAGKKVVCETTAACSQSVAVAFQMAQSVGGAKGMLVWKKRRGGGRKSQDGGRETGGDKGLFGHHPSLPLPLFQRERRQKKSREGKNGSPLIPASY